MMIRGDGHNPAAPFGSSLTFLSLGPGWSSLCNTPFRRHKSWVHEGGDIDAADRSLAGRRCRENQMRHTPGHIVDIVPTILDVAGGTRGDTWDGQPTPAAPGKSLCRCSPRMER